MEPGAWTGLLIGVAVVVVILILIHGAFKIPEYFEEIDDWYKSGQGTGLQQILYAPVWFLLGLLSVIVVLLSALALVSLANDAKKWWHKK